MSRLLLGAAALCATVACTKVPLADVNAGFTLADATWFAEEQTLFIFYDVTAEQGLGELSQVEITYTTDDERVDWTPVEDFPTVHTHLALDCGPNERCGSTSIFVAQEPRDVGVRLRYHRDGALALDAPTVYNVVGIGDPARNRSVLVYGVFDERNERVQWRERHNFPTLRNQQVEAMGLRRAMIVDEQRYGEVPDATGFNPYAYGKPCADALVDYGAGPVHTVDRAAFNDTPVPVEGATAQGVCAAATVYDALGSFTTTAVARKNPETRAAFPELRSPVKDALTLPFFLGPCDRVISADHEEMQRQRLGLEGVLTTCTDDVSSTDLVAKLVTDFRAALEAARPSGRDMVLTIALHQDQPTVVRALRDALTVVLPSERGRTTPRLAGAYVFDSVPYTIQDPTLAATTLWCPATAASTDVVGACVAIPLMPEINLGPFSFNSLPILPSRTRYLDFIDAYSKAQAGEMTSLALRVPEFATTADHLDLGDAGAVTFLNGEHLDAAPDDAFSYCEPEMPLSVVFRSALMQDPGVVSAVQDACWAGELAGPICDFAGFPVATLDALPDWHALVGEERYELGLYWQFPFLVSMEYELVVAGSVTAFGLSVPFGVHTPAETFLGSDLWLSETFSLNDALTQCRRFCDHPTFDSAGVYQVNTPFRTGYAHACYHPRFPAVGDPGYPLDP